MESPNQRYCKDWDNDEIRNQCAAKKIPVLQHGRKMGAIDL